MLKAILRTVITIDVKGIQNWIREILQGTCHSSPDKREWSQQVGRISGPNNWRSTVGDGLWEWFSSGLPVSIFVYLFVATLNSFGLCWLLCCKMEVARTSGLQSAISYWPLVDLCRILVGGKYVPCNKQNSQTYVFCLKDFQSHQKERPYSISRKYEMLSFGIWENFRGTISNSTWARKWKMFSLVILISSPGAGRGFLWRSN